MIIHVPSLGDEIPVAYRPQIIKEISDIMDTRIPTEITRDYLDSLNVTGCSAKPIYWVCVPKNLMLLVGTTAITNTSVHMYDSDYRRFSVYLSFNGIFTLVGEFLNGVYTPVYYPTGLGRSYYEVVPERCVLHNVTRVYFNNAVPVRIEYSIMLGNVVQYINLEHDAIIGIMELPGADLVSHKLDETTLEQRRYITAMFRYVGCKACTPALQRHYDDTVLILKISWLLQRYMHWVCINSTGTGTGTFRKLAHLTTYDGTIVERILHAKAWDNLLYYSIVHNMHSEVMRRIIANDLLHMVPRTILIQLYQSSTTSTRRIVREQLRAHKLHPIEGIVFKGSSLKTCWSPAILESFS